MALSRRKELIVQPMNIRDKYAKEYAVERVPRKNGKVTKRVSVYKGKYYRFDMTDDALHGLKIIFASLSAALVILFLVTAFFVTPASFGTYATPSADDYGEFEYSAIMDAEEVAVPAGEYDYCIMTEDMSSLIDAPNGVYSAVGNDIELKAGFKYTLDVDFGRAEVALDSEALPGDNAEERAYISFTHRGTPRYSELNAKLLLDADANSYGRLFGRTAPKIYVEVTFYILMLPLLMIAYKVVMILISPRRMERFTYETYVMKLRRWLVATIIIAGAAIIGEAVAIAAGVESKTWVVAVIFIIMNLLIAAAAWFFIRVYDKYQCVEDKRISDM